MNSKIWVCGVCVAAAVGLSAAPASADLVYYWQGGGGGQDQSYSYAIADSFTVNTSSRYIDTLAVFDSNYASGGAITADIYVALVDDTTGKVVIGPTDFRGVTDPSKSEYVTLGLGQNYYLNKGDTYSIEAWGFNNANMFEAYVDTNGKSNVGFDSFGGALADYGSENCNGFSQAFNGKTGSLIGGGGSCSPLNNHGLDFFGGGSIDLQVPEPAGWPIILSGLVGCGLLAMRRRRRREQLV